MGEKPRDFPEPPRPRPTGRRLVLFKRGVDAKQAASSIENKAGVRAVNAREFGASATAMHEAVSKGNAVVFERFKVAVLPSDGNGARAGALAAAEEVRSTRPEFFMFAINDLGNRYSEWVREGLQLLAEGGTTAFASARAVAAEAGALAAPFADSDEFTWGLVAVGAHDSGYTGRGIRVAVLDTGLDLEHPDFKGRNIVTQSFVPGQTVQDVQGHGTHTAGTIAGPKQSKIGRRYGVAPDVELYVGKVLDDGGAGREGDILNGMNWAIEQKCVAISMSLGRPTFPDEKPDPLYEEAGAAAIAEDCIIVAAAGNESARDFGHIAPVTAPANSPSILSVAAVDPKMKVAPFSCGGLTSGGGEVNVSGPGVSVYSSFPRPRDSRLLQGTSMACPHAAGVAALWAQSDPKLRGQKLWDALLRSGRSLGSARDFGAGLVQAPDRSVGV